MKGRMNELNNGIIKRINEIKDRIKYLRVEPDGFSIIDYEDNVFYCKDKNTFMLLAMIKNKPELQSMINQDNLSQWDNKISYLEKVFGGDKTGGDLVVDTYPITMSLNISEKCNYRCIHCYEMIGRANEKPFLNLEECETIAGQAKELGIITVVITGGEPLLNANVYEICKLFKRMGFRVILNTNGECVNDLTAKKIKDTEIDHLHLSLDGNSDTHNYIRQNRDAYNNIINAIEVLKKQGIIPELLFTANTINYHQIEDVLRFAKDNELSINIKRFIPTKKRAQDYLILSAAEMEYVIDAAEKHSNDGKKEVKIDPCFNLKRGMSEFNKCMFISNQVTTIDARGNVYICPYMQDDIFSLGNVFEKKLIDIWKEYFIDKKLFFEQSQLHGACIYCTKFGDCSGGCRAYAYYVKQDYYASDICKFIEKGGE